MLSIEKKIKQENTGMNDCALLMQYHELNYAFLDLKKGTDLLLCQQITK